MNALQSMTGFSSAVASTDTLRALCEMRSVNGKNLDIRLRLPAGFEALEAPIKKSIGAYVSRGNVQVTLTLEHAGQAAGIHIDENAFAALAAQARALSVQHGLQAPTTDGILAARGIVLSDDAQGTALDDASQKMASDLLVKAAEEAAAALVNMREVEGVSLHGLLSGHLSSIDDLVSRARADKANQPEAIMARLSAQIDTLLEGRDDAKLDGARLNAEAAVLATKADIREEIDRLDAHVAAARALLDEGGAIGRKLDFLAQEFNRETNTICSKSASATLTATGLDLKAVIDQFREQVQNLQ